MPAMHLTSVDLPAPLSPTSAMTSPLLTWKSTPFSACTAPKCLWTSRSSRRASVLNLVPPPSVWRSVGRRHRGDAPASRSRPLLDSGLLAGRCVLPCADLLRGQEPVGDHRVLDVGRGHGDRLQQHRGRLRAL